MSKRIVAFTGAGISKASGIPTYQERPWLRQLFTRNYLTSHPERFFAEYYELMQLLDQAQPNPAHYALAEHHIPIVTQNIDGLHHKAGSQTVVELHGTYNRFICTKCGVLYHSFSMTDAQRPLCSSCGQPSLRPDIVLYGEDIKDWWHAFDLVGQADTLLVIGTSLEVYPAALLPDIARRNGSRIIMINQEAEVRVPQILNMLC